MRVRDAAVLAVLGVLVGCNSATNPSGINGTWTFTANNLSGTEASNTSETAGFACVLIMNVSLTQSGSTVIGNVSGTASFDGEPNSSVNCTRNGEQIGPYFQHGQITAGSVSGDTVTFGAFEILGGWTFTGTVSGNSMSGELSLKLPLCDCLVPPAPVTSDTMLVTGHWSATRN